MNVRKWLSIGLTAVVIAVTVIFLLPSGVIIVSNDGYVSISVHYALAAGEDVSNTPNSYAFGIVDINQTLSTGLSYFTLTNSGVISDITISGTDMLGGVTWTLSSTATPGSNTIGYKAGMVSPTLAVGFVSGDEQESTGFTSGDSQGIVGWEGQGEYSIVIKPSDPNYLIKKLPSGATIKWGFELLTPTEVTDGEPKTGTITLTAAAS